MRAELRVIPQRSAVLLVAIAIVAVWPPSARSAPQAQAFSHSEFSVDEIITSGTGSHHDTTVNNKLYVAKPNCDLTFRRRACARR